ncbi:MAG: hypothetical protein HQM08_28935 [Candidatus Riflebacteria bacterium]|nr:hypothetical protein [Candidatus Riflebacteria bacterium]
MKSPSPDEKPDCFDLAQAKYFHCDQRQFFTSTKIAVLSFRLHTLDILQKYFFYFFFAILLSFLHSLPSNAQATEPISKPKPQSFPDWMDKVEFPGQSDKKSLQPIEPIDPDPKSENVVSPQTGFKGTVKFQKPDFSKLSKIRGKALKVEYSKTPSGSSTTQIQQVQVSNLEEEQKRIDELEKIISSLPDSPEKIQKMTILGERKNRLAAAKELAALPTQSESNEKSTNLTPYYLKPLVEPTTQKHIENLISIINNGKPEASAAKISSPTTKIPSKIPRRFYKPKGVKSIFTEMKEGEISDEQSFEESE